MSLTYKTRHGIDWPSTMPDVLIDLTIGKKWRLLEQALGTKIKDPWVPMLDAARALIPRDLFRVSEWTEQHFHDFVSYDKLITWGCASSSKAQPYYSTVFTPDGPKRMGSVKVGDMVLGADGKPTKVRKIHELGEQEIFTLEFTDGTSCQCANTHLWAIYEDGAKYPCVMGTEYVKAALESGKTVEIPTCGAAQFSPVATPIDPYLFGALIGGDNTAGAIAGAELDLTEASSDAVASLTGYSKSYIDSLRGLHAGGESAKDRFIPMAYKYNTPKVRQAVLNGILAAGEVTKEKKLETYVTPSVRLAEDVAWIIRSLGGVCCVSVDYKRNVYKVTFQRKAKRKELKKITTSKEKTKMRCITVEAPDGLYLTEDFIVTHNSNDTALLLVLDWVVDPYDTVTLLGSTTKEDLKSRSWEGVERYHHALRNNKLGFLVPGKISKQGQKLINHDEDDVAGSSGEKAGIQGRAINEGGRLQGAHAKYVRLVVDELAEISNHEAIKTAIANLRVGTTSFKFIGLANPESWDNPSCQYCEPPEGRDKVDVDTGSWFSTFGCFVRHHDGLKSPCVKDPSLRSEFPFLMSMDEYESVLREAGGNPDAPQIWKMIRGFPVPLGSMIPTVLDPKIAAENLVGELIPDANMYPAVGVAAGIDPAWSEGGDGAYHCKVVVRMINGKPVLDFGGGLSRLTISATDSRPVTKQLRDQVIAIMRTPGNSPLLRNTAIDSSGNQGLADDLDITLSDACLHVNSSQRASDNSLRATDNRKAKEIVYDRGTESWAVLAEFCRAGMVRGLPQEALNQLTQRRYACRNGTTAQLFPLRMEPKDKFRQRFKKSPDEADACALAALAVKERLGIIPFNFILPKNATVDDNRFLGQLSQPDNLQELPSPGEYEDEFDYGAYAPF